MRVLVTGGKGDLGHRLVPLLRQAGHEVLVGTRRPRNHDEVYYALDADPDPDLLADVDVLVHLASDAFHPDDDAEGAARLWQAGRQAGISHAIFISIVGIDEHPFRYYQAKRKAEQVLADSGLPHSILRTTQFHSFIPRLVDEFGARLRVVPVPGRVAAQPIDPDVVARRLAELVDQGPSGRLQDLAGPEVLSLDEIVDEYRREKGRRWPRLRLPLAGKTVAGFRQGLHLADADAEVAGCTYREYLEAV